MPTVGGVEDLLPPAVCPAVLLSGGVDSSAVLLAALRGGVKPHAFTVSLSGCGVDIPFAIYVASSLEVPLTVVSVGLEEALAAIEEVVGALKVFNPMEVVNCAVQYIGIKEAARWGYGKVCTGDGGDELYLGYSFYRNIPLDKLEAKRREVVSKWRFCSFQIGKTLGVEVEAPFTRLEAVEAALSISASEALGKRPVRERLRPVLPLVAEREKTPMEAGSCFNRLYEEMRKRAGDEVRYLYEIYRRLGFTYPRSPSGCPRCGYAYFDRYCPMCGYYKPQD
ncbi:MAG: asparagine synthase C-terminal domain-containing protein [Pyrobaculum sp.]